jgi:hypothetical protein
VVPAEDLRLAHWAFAYDSSGTMLYADACWLDDAGRCVPGPTIRLPATTPPNEVTTEFEAPR